MDVHFHIQDPYHTETTYLYEAIIEATADAALWRGVYAFASRDGVVHLFEDPAVEKFMQNGGEIDLLVGLDAVTNRTTLERLQELEQKNNQFRPKVFWNETGGLFHPKLSEFKYTNGSRKLIVGSGNLTPGGLMTNYEGYTIISTAHDENLDVSELDDFLMRHTKEIRSIDNEALDRADQNRIQPISGKRKTGRISTRTHRHGQTRIITPRRKSVSTFDRILVAQVPKAAGRWSQAHFNADVIKEYFRITDLNSQRVFLTLVDKNGNRADTEVRQCIYSHSNRNHKIEIGAAKGKAYPASPPADSREWFPTRHHAAKGKAYPASPPVLVFRERNLRIFDYVLLFPEDDEYAAVFYLTTQLPTIGHGLPRIVTNMDQLKRAWGNCPLLIPRNIEKQEI